jgi:hypothetical protein
MPAKTCPTCGETLQTDCFRKGASSCVWCVFSAKSKRAKARYRDKQKLAKGRLSITMGEFVAWYEAQHDR